MGASGGSPDGTREVHHGTDELLIQQNTIPDGETASPVQERSQRSQPLRRFLSHLIDMFRSGEPFIKGHPKITGVVDPLNWPRRAELVGVSGYAYRSWRRALRSSSS